MDLKESDWKVFRKLRELALERFCEQVLSEVKNLASNPSDTPHDCYLAIYKMIHQRNKEMAEAFDGLSRSRAWLQIVSIQKHKLLTEEEMRQFSPEMVESVNRFFNDPNAMS